MSDQNNSYNVSINEARNNIEQKKYSEAIDNLDLVIENNSSCGECFYLRGKAYGGLNKYKLALKDLELALEIFKDLGDKRSQYLTLNELIFMYSFNGKMSESLSAQQESLKLLKQLKEEGNIGEDDPSYKVISDVSQGLDESLGDSSSKWDKFGFMGKMMGFANQGKWQSYVVFALFLIMAIPSLAVSLILFPFWLPKLMRQMRQRHREKEQK